MAIKSIHINTDGSVRAILDGRKSCTRRIMKPQLTAHYGTQYAKPPYQPGDILYVRETWEHFDCCSCEGDEHGNCPKEPQKSVIDKRGYGCYMYRATDEISGDAKWHPPRYMPKEAARIWLKVTDVKIERLQDVTEDGAKAEGAIDNRGFIHSPENEYDRIHTAREHFIRIWNSTIKKSNLNRYGWDASPWVWVIEFERCEKPETKVN
ncbi:hypothetical protein [Roseburia intestinalis]|uniref:hypothetical protein n=1 Tax=Roseburia intestinalis TaxID=166486 RepID=UPI00189FA01C|nr:hypothetical protein [Roseburia intestinalis]